MKTSSYNCKRVDSRAVHGVFAFQLCACVCHLCVCVCLSASLSYSHDCVCAEFIYSFNRKLWAFLISENSIEVRAALWTLR